jgi:hypothetical protein
MMTAPGVLRKLALNSTIKSTASFLIKGRNPEIKIRDKN